ncbi:MAG: hypothetical protein ACKV2V_10935 [Blastocatellia bacterium]
MTDNPTTGVAVVDINVVLKESMAILVRASWQWQGIEWSDDVLRAGLWRFAAKLHAKNAKPWMASTFLREDGVFSRHHVEGVAILNLPTGRQENVGRKKTSPFVLPFPASRFSV